MNYIVKPPIAGQACLRSTCKLADAQFTQFAMQILNPKRPFTPEATYYNSRARSLLFHAQSAAGSFF